MPTRPAAPIRIGLAGAAVLVLALGVPAALAADRDVAISDFAFSPGTTRIRVGDSVTWVNRDPVAHTATARNGSFDTGLLDEGESRSVRFTVPGTYRYICTPHPEMAGTVVVRAVPTGVQPPATDTASPAELRADRTPTIMLAGLLLALVLLPVRALRRRLP